MNVFFSQFIKKVNLCFKELSPLNELILDIVFNIYSKSQHIHIKIIKKNYHKNLLNKKNSSSQLPNKTLGKKEKKKSTLHNS